ncbi:LPS export ABC transporter permease LptG [Sphingomonas sp.]|jgi:lipopolysaccharide export system permease protein|uniref:LPS export ABC transporter permease LptG n=1 Tax=Sphingomonas sp. TaxID=28214 RepID=UPI002DED3133|nr:LPS export ABC transporter permease LptG [Sphingomonas sp.]HEV2569635.1 LPS export ABC transporter permease LptG [Sphingomonas sp.]
MQLQFFPSTTIMLYTARMFLVRSFAVLAGLVLILMTLDLLGESGKILAHPGNGEPELWTYVSLRVPQIVARFLPFSVLLGTLITLLTLNQNSEVISMKASGLSAHQILAPLIVAGLFVAGLSFAFNERVVARATATLKAWSKVEYGPMPKGNNILSNLWVRNGEDLIRAGRAIGRGAGTRLIDVTLYDRVGNELAATIEAKEGRYVGGAWRLTEARRFDVSTGMETRLGTIIAARGVTPDRFTLANVDPEGLSFMQLRQAIEDLKAAGRPTRPLEAALWHKLSGPLSSVLMPLLGAVAGFGLARSGKLFVRAVAGMALGFAYFVADNFALAMGNLGAYPPLLAAWAPFLLFLLIGETVLVRTEE